MTMTTSTPTSALLPAVLGGSKTFPTGLRLNRPWLPDLPSLERRVGAVLATGQLTDGPTVRELEEAAAARLGVADVVAVASCTSGLILTLQALGVRGDVVMPSFTFSASAHAVVWVGGRPRFADISETTLCLDAEHARGLLHGAAAMTATHIYGTPCDTEALEQTSRTAGIPLVFDAAHAFGSRHRGRPVGSFGVAEVFSLSPTKVMVAGEGGLVATDDAALAEEIRLGRNYGNPGDYNCAFPGLNARMSELHAAVALHSLRWLDENIARRNELVELFWAVVAGTPGLRRPLVEPGDVSTYKDLTVVVDAVSLGMDVPTLAWTLHHEGIETRRYFFPAVHAQDAYRHLPPVELPMTDRIAPAVLSLPLWAHMTDADMRAMADALVRLHGHAGEARALHRSQEATT